MKVRGNALIKCFDELKDYRVVGRCTHKLTDIIMLSICAVICGANSWTDIEDFGHAKLSWLKKVLELPGGIPSHDTLGRVFSLINPVKFEACFLKWVNFAFEMTGGEIIPIDGKSLRRSYDKKSEKAPIHMVSAWSAKNGIVLGQVATSEKSNEITAIPKLLDLLDVNGCIITIDAMGCQKDIARTIIDGGGDYVIAIKNNQPTLFHEVVECMENAIEEAFYKNTSTISFYETMDNGHGREEKRRYYIMDDLEDVESSFEWPGLNSIGMVESLRTVDGETSINRRYYISSIEKDGKTFGIAVRKHWHIENSLHWVLDVSFREDESRIRQNNGPENFAVFRRIALNSLKNEKSSKRGLKAKRMRAGWDEKYLAKVIGF